MSHVITGGIVRYEDGIKAAEEYAPARKAAVELRFDIPEGQDTDEAISTVLALATAKVYELLGTTPKKAAAPKKAATAAKVPDLGQAATVEDKAATVEARADPAAIEEEVPVKEISDSLLNEKVQAKNAVLGDPVKIRTLISTFNPDPTQHFVLRELPQSQRQSFLDKLKELA